MTGREEMFWQPVFDIEERPDGTILMRQQGELGEVPRALPDRLVHWAEAAPDRCFLAERAADGSWRRLSYAQVLDQVRALGQGLLEAGLGPDRPLLILSRNSVDHALLGLAAQYAGVPYAPISTAYSLVSTDHGKVRDIAALLRPGMVYAENGAAYRGALEAACGEAGADCIRLVSVNAAPGDRDYESLRATAPGAQVDAAYAALTPDSVGKYLFTSGSTGSPKAVINTQYMMCSNQVMIADSMRFLAQRPPVVVDWAPWNHTASGNKVFNMVLWHGGTYHVDEGRPTPEGMTATIRNLKEVAPTWYFNVPVAWERLVQAFDADPELKARFFSRLDLMMYAGAGMAQHLWDALRRHAREATGRDILLTTALGATETGPFALFCTEPQDSPGNIGVPAKGITLKLVPNDGKLEARLKSPSITPGYKGAPEVTAQHFDEEGFYRLGDAIRPANPQDLARGFLFDGRVAENFKLATGTWVAVGALRAKLVDHFGGLIRDAVIVGEDRDFLTAIVLPAEPAPDAATLRERLDSFAAGATGSSTRICRIVPLDSAPDIDRGEVTDKGSINQRAVIRNRPHLVEALYEGGPEVIGD
ncbi:AMP-binding protein [Aquicoccus sp. SCR17]|nr:AMP-binding protein [Carideicomes alvinocaridis]